MLKREKDFKALHEQYLLASALVRDLQAQNDLLKKGVSLPARFPAASNPCCSWYGVFDCGSLVIGWFSPISLSKRG